MTIRRPPIFALLLALLPGCAAPPTAESPRFYEAATTTKPYADVLAELELAITEHNFRITGHNRIGSVIRVEQATPAGMRTYSGTLLAVGNGLTLREADGQLRVLSDYSGFTLAAAPEGLVARPTLRFLVEAGGERTATLDYATAGLAWRAEYRADLRSEDRNCAMRFEGNAMVVNRSGLGFDDVRLSLIAGEPNRRVDGLPHAAVMARAVAAPMPLFPPLMSATRPVSLPMITLREKSASAVDQFPRCPQPRLDRAVHIALMGEAGVFADEVNPSRPLAFHAAILGELAG